MTTRICALSGEVFEISEREQAYCEEHAIPFPQAAPRERFRNMFAFGSLTHLFQTQCAVSGKRLLSFVPPEIGRPVMDVGIWSEDSWDSASYGVAYNFSRPFFEQFRELLYRVPLPNLALTKETIENSEYAHGVVSAKNCYLVFGATNIQDCLFSRYLLNCRDVLDSLMAFDCELCYGCTDIRACYDLKFSEHCTNCSESAFLSNCRACRHCYGCANLSGKDYYYYNRQLAPKEYEALVGSIDLGSHTALNAEISRFESFKDTLPLRYMRGDFNEGSSGNFLSHTQRCLDSYFCSDAQDLDHCLWVFSCHDCFFFCSHGERAERIYNCYGCGTDATNLKFCGECFPNAHDLEYCLSTSHGSNNCFGCVSMRRKQYCILNRQYSKAEYFELVGRIKKQMLASGEYGRFFPPQLSPVFYNHSQAIEFVGGTRAEVEALGYRWKEAEPQVQFAHDTLPDHIRDLSLDATDKTFASGAGGAPYRLVRQEIQFYKRMNIAAPRLAPLERVRLRAKILRLGDPRQTQCSRCAAPFESVYATEQREVLCGECFGREVER